MKILLVIILCACFFSVLAYNAQAEDFFPEFTKSDMTIYLPIRAIEGYEADPNHELGLNVKYTLENSQLFTEQATGHIQTIEEGFSGTTDRSTPWRTITELVAAYQRQDIDAVRSLFTEESQSKIDEILADPELKERYFEFMQAIQSVNVLVGFDYKDGYFAMLEIRYKDMLPDERVAPSPVFLKKQANMYIMSATKLEAEDTMDANIALFLQQGHEVEDLLKPPAPEHTLTIEKSGTGNGVVEGTDIDCGADCVGIYQEGSVLFLKAIAEGDSVFEGWLVDGNPTKGKLEMNQDTTITAVFTKK